MLPVRKFESFHAVEFVLRIYHL